MRKTKIAIIGGSGIYDIDGLVGATWTDVETPGGAIRSGFDRHIKRRRHGVFTRHGRGHVYSPTTVPYRANIDALKRLGVTDVISVSACGSFRDEMAPAILLSWINLSTVPLHAKSRFWNGLCGPCFGRAPHLSPPLGGLRSGGKRCWDYRHNGGTYLAMEGPQFSSIAESKMYRESWGADVIGMTNMPEAKLAREAELCYASVAMITDYDSWHPEHGSVDITSIIATLQGNAGKARDLVGRLPALLGQERDDCPHGCDKALEFAIMTAPINAIPN